MPPVIVLIATYPRIDALKSLSIPSIAQQTRLADTVVIVSDRNRLSAKDVQDIQSMLPQTEICSYFNEHSAGAAGAWNTGLSYIQQLWPNAYVAILDDDDWWDCDHLATCMDTATVNDWPEVVVSGLRMVSAGVEIPRELPLKFSIDDFLIGNPGWQGSNTFASISTLMKAGGFTDGLTSCNDRDLAIRILSLQDVNITYTGRFTSTWNFNASPNSLSQKGKQKQEALRQFLSIHHHRMSEDVRRGFLNRCKDLFGVLEEDLI